MKLIEKRTLQVFSAVAAVAALGLLTPRAAHAIAAAMVQVTNTVANPVMTQSINTQAAQLLDIACYTAAQGTQEGCATVSGSGEYSAPTYAVPANQAFVVTAVDIQPNTVTGVSPCANSAQGSEGITISTNQAFRKAWYFNGANTVHFEYPSGFVLSPGQVLTDFVGAGNVCPASIELHGYLTAN